MVRDAYALSDRVLGSHAPDLPRRRQLPRLSARFRAHGPLWALGGWTAIMAVALGLTLVGLVVWTLTRRGERRVLHAPGTRQPQRRLLQSPGPPGQGLRLDATSATTLTPCPARPTAASPAPGAAPRTQPCGPARCGSSRACTTSPRTCATTAWTSWPRTLWLVLCSTRCSNNSRSTPAGSPFSTRAFRLLPRLRARRRDAVGTKRFHHPVVSERELVHESFSLPGDDGLSIIRPQRRSRHASCRRAAAPGQLGRHSEAEVSRRTDGHLAPGAHPRSPPLRAPQPGHATEDSHCERNQGESRKQAVGRCP